MKSIWVLGYIDICARISQHPALRAISTQSLDQAMSYKLFFSWSGLEMEEISVLILADIIAC